MRQANILCWEYSHKSEHGNISNSSAVLLFLFNPSSQTVQHLYKEHNRMLQQDCQITSRKWRSIWLPSYQSTEIFSKLGEKSLQLRSYEGIVLATSLSNFWILYQHRGNASHWSIFSGNLPCLTNDRHTKHEKMTSVCFSLLLSE